MNTELARFDARPSVIMTMNADADHEQVIEVALSRLRKKRAACCGWKLVPDGAGAGAVHRTHRGQLPPELVESVGLRLIIRRRR